MALEMWNGSVWVTVATGTRPMWRVTGATREATSTASGLPASQRGSISGRRRRCGVSASSKVTKSSSPRSAVTASSDQYRPLVTGSASGDCRHASGCQP